MLEGVGQAECVFDCMLEALDNHLGGNSLGKATMTAVFGR
jgi:hypothetical protein